MTAFDDDLRLAHVLADQADATTTARFRAPDLRVVTKPDGPPVTDADRTVEEQLRAQLARARPRDAIIGEELGGGQLGGQQHGWGRRWVIDPIDGTKSFVRGVPVWATLIGLLDGDEPVVGVVSAPALGRRWWAASGAGAWAGRGLTSARPAHVSSVRQLDEASLSYSSLSGWQKRGALDGFLELARSCWRTRAYGDFWSYMLLAEGGVDIACEPELALHDMVALVPIVTEAGGRFTDLSGRDGPHGGSAVATNGQLHERVLAALTGGGGDYPSRS
jgi:histidinol-phosphatase